MTEANLSPKLQSVVSKIKALRKLTKDTGTLTTRSQNTILRSLSDEELTAVAEALAR